MCFWRLWIWKCYQDIQESSHSHPSHSESLLKCDGSHFSTRVVNREYSHAPPMLMQHHVYTYQHHVCNNSTLPAFSFPELVSPTHLLSTHLVCQNNVTDYLNVFLKISPLDISFFYDFMPPSNRRLIGRFPIILHVASLKLWHLKHSNSCHRQLVKILDTRFDQLIIKLVRLPHKHIVSM